jgi:hypothetical protein
MKVLKWRVNVLGSCFGGSRSESDVLDLGGGANKPRTVSDDNDAHLLVVVQLSSRRATRA